MPPSARSDVASLGWAGAAATPWPGIGLGGAAEGARLADAPTGVMLLISSLEHGGAERQVVELARNLDRTRFTPVVCSLSTHVPLARDLPDRDRDLVIVEKRSKYDYTTIARAAAVMAERCIKVVHAFLFDAEMVARLAARRASVPVVVASERNADYERPLLHKLGQLLTRSRFDAMIANSEAGKRFNVRTLGIKPERIYVVHNGVDTARFRPMDGVCVRRELGIPANAPVVGMVAQFKRQKRHADFFEVARRTLLHFPNAWFVCIGEPLRDNQQGAGDYHREMWRLVAKLGLERRCLFLGRRDDMPQVYSACDITMLTSSREGTPNVLLESMACRVPIVATEVADNAQVAPNGRVGFIAPAGDIGALTARLIQLLDDAPGRRAMGLAARHWVEQEFSTAALASRTGSIYEQLLQRKRAKGRRNNTQ